MGLVCTLLVKGDIKTSDESWRENHSLMSSYEPDMYFGSIPRSMFTLFNLIMMVEYAEFLRPMFFHDPVLCPILIAFSAFIVFGVLNVLVGIIVENMAQSNKDMEREEELFEE